MADQESKYTFKKNKKNRKVLIFDENARREYLTGFHKRKVQRKTKAAEELQKKLKAERKRIRTQARRAYEKLIQCQKPIPEVEHVTEELDMGTHSVCVTELSPAAIAKKHNWIEINQVEYQASPNESQVKNDVNSDCSDIEGMEIKPKKNRIIERDLAKLKTAKDFKKAIKKEATQHLQKSKVFKRKSRVSQIKNMKKKRREENRRQKFKKKSKKTKRMS